MCRRHFVPIAKKQLAEEQDNGEGVKFKGNLKQLH